MNTPDDILADAVGLRTYSSANKIFEVIERRLLGHGASHVLISGLPMPGRPVEPLVLHIRWPDIRSERGQLITNSKGDPELERCRVAHRPCGSAGPGSWKNRGRRRGAAAPRDQPLSAWRSRSKRAR